MRTVPIAALVVLPGEFLHRHEAAVLVELGPQDLEVCRAIAARKRELVVAGAIAHRASYATRTPAEERAQDEAGARGEWATGTLLFGAEHMAGGWGEFSAVRAIGVGDAGIDLWAWGQRIQVKTSTAEEADLALWLPGTFDPASCDVLVLAWCPPGRPEAEVIIVGWTLAQDLEAKARRIRTKFGERIVVDRRLLSAASWLPAFVQLNLAASVLLSSKTRAIR